MATDIIGCIYGKFGKDCACNTEKGCILGGCDVEHFKVHFPGNNFIVDVHGYLNFVRFIRDTLRPQGYKVRYIMQEVKFGCAQNYHAYHYKCEKEVKE